MSNDTPTEEKAFASTSPYDGAIHMYFSLSYSNYLVLNRTTLMLMPPTWQDQFVRLLRDHATRFDAIETASSFEVHAARDRYVNALSADEKKMAGVEEIWNDNESDSILYDKDGNELDGHSHILLPAHDPIPHYKDYSAVERLRQQLAASSPPVQQPPVEQGGAGRPTFALKPIGDPLPLYTCPPGFFLFEGMVGFNSEYNEVYCDSGEYFWGGKTSKSDTLDLLVTPLGLIIPVKPSPPPAEQQPSPVSSTPAASGGEAGDVLTKAAEIAGMTAAELSTLTYWEVGQLGETKLPAFARLAACVVRQQEKHQKLVNMLEQTKLADWLADRDRLATENARLAAIVDAIKAAHAERSEMMRQGMDVKTATLGCHIAVVAALASTPTAADPVEQKGGEGGK